ncbi:MAG: hypothetical protein LBT34_02420 [Clostridiales Family XIII bacterium]|nr:hypothetical protein [Clostridiales Family XIII bacterium]
MGIQEFLHDYLMKKPVSFHMPGHKGGRFYERFGYGAFSERFIDCDITEIPGADNLFLAEGILKELQDGYAALYGVKKSWLLINGGSGGLIAAVLASSPAGKPLIMARNSHKSIFNALTLGGLTPVYMYPEIIEEYGIPGEMRPEETERLLRENPDAEAVILPSPNYYGVCSDIERIAEAVHRAGKILIVDQAHGAHLAFFDRYEGGAAAGKRAPLSAELSGADLIVNSTHKTLASLTQTAVLNLNSDRVDPEALEDKLQCVESTSPSYLLMLSADINREILERHGRALIEEWNGNLDGFYRAAETVPGLKVMNAAGRFDRTKINIDMSARGISGTRLKELLMEENICAELSSGGVVMCMTGVGNVRGDYEALAAVLRRISESRGFGREAGERREPDTEAKIETEEALYPPKIPEFAGIPETKRRVKLEAAEGLICAASVIPYPPGVPLLCPGERVGRDAVAYIAALRRAGGKVTGVTADGEIFAG